MDWETRAAGFSPVIVDVVVTIRFSSEHCLLFETENSMRQIFELDCGAAKKTRPSDGVRSIKFLLYLG